MIDALLNFDFIRYSLISGLLIGFIAPLIGAFIVVRRLSLIADALSHVTLGGISFGMFFAYHYSSFLSNKPYVVWYSFCCYWSVIN